ncbi:unnamed protein product [Cylindrotheca closterium]|uniref:Uncharacterized protein n=1 Tax=Cylindrotheca closterium TaxID=2856 RepID=A0AAD2JGT5_9STRA|nr:unnamed protein product [Cylindrotheca closterium]
MTRNSLQSFMSCLLEEHSVSASDIDIQIDNAKSSRSLFSSCSDNDGSGHSRSLDSSLRRDSDPLSPKQIRGRAKKDRWDSSCEKQLTTPKRCSSPMNLSKMITFMDLQSSGDAPLKFPSRSREDNHSDESVHELLDDVLAILR